MELQGFKSRLIPTLEQEQLMWQAAGVSRFAWNWGLAFQMKRFVDGEKLLSEYDLRDEFKKLRGIEEYSWLKESSAKTAYLALYDLMTAYKRFFKLQKQGDKFTAKTVAKAKRQSRKLTPYDMKGHPKFKKRDKCEPSFAQPNDALYFKKDTVILQKIGTVKMKTNYELPQGRGSGKFFNPRVSFVSGKWLLSFTMECENQAYKLEDYSVGIDLGIKTLATISYGMEKTVFKNINKTLVVRKLKRRLKRAQKAVSRKFRVNKNYTATNNVKKAKDKVKTLYSKISSIRHDYTHKVTTSIVSLLPKTIVMEELNIQGMMKNRHLSKAIQEQTFYEFRRQMEYKTKRRGIALKIADKWFPSSKKCSCCGNVKKDLKLKDRVYKCDGCGLEIDRDFNAAKNLEKLAG